VPTSGENIYDYKTSATFIERDVIGPKKKRKCHVVLGNFPTHSHIVFRGQGLGMFSGIVALCIDSSHGKLYAREGLALAAEDLSSIGDHLVFSICRLHFLATIKTIINSKCISRLTIYL